MGGRGWLGARNAIVFSALVLSISGVMLSVLVGSATSVTNRAAAYPQATVELAQSTTQAPVGSIFSLTATVIEAGDPQPGRLITFTVSGANPQAATNTTNEAGRAGFAYVGKAAGVDHIVASFLDKSGATVTSNEVTQTWTGPPPPVPSPTGQVLPFKQAIEAAQKLVAIVLAAPQLGKSVNVETVSGVVFVKLPTGAHASRAGASGSAHESLIKGAGFIPLTEARQIPVGSTLDTTGGVAQITSATNATGKMQVGDFGAGLFTILQNRKQHGLTDLNIHNTRSKRQACATIGKKARAAKQLSRGVLGRLKGSAHGKYTTRGQFSAATVRGTIWSVTNRCDGTLTQVTRGVVSVRDFARRKTISLRAGQRYLAAAP